MQGLILAAGMGKRLKDLTKNNTKCMIKVDDVTLIERMLNQLDKLNLSKIILVIGYKGEELAQFISTLNIKTPIEYVKNDIYDKTNNIYSLYLAKQYLKQDDTLLLESDIIMQDGILESLVNDERKSLALVDKIESWMSGTCVKLNSNDEITDFVLGKDFNFQDIDYYYKTVNIYKFSKDFSEFQYVPFLEAYLKSQGVNQYYEQVLKSVTMLDMQAIRAKRLEGELWYEIDDTQDLDIANSIFMKDKQKQLTIMQNRYGGYWRYPKLLDFCYLVNPYYPPKKLVEEIKSNFGVLLTQYPSGMSINSFLAGKFFNVKQDYIVIGNGAAELIKSLMISLNGKIGIIRPTFEEYPNRYKKEDCVVFTPENENFSYTANDLIDFYKDKDIGALVLINPDNPSGNYLQKNDVIKIAKFLSEEKNDAMLILDESFSDFAEEDDNTFLNNELLVNLKNLVVVKSISKSYGVPGLRLGVLASSKQDLITAIKKDVGIWNINSFAEFYMQIAHKYSKEYDFAMSKFKEVRKIMFENLKLNKNIRVVPSQANYFTLEILNDKTSIEVIIELLSKHNIFIKDLTSKINNGKQYIRVAIRTEAENAKLINALGEILEKK